MSLTLIFRLVSDLHVQAQWLCRGTIC